MNAPRILDSTQNVRLNESAPRRRSVSISLLETTTSLFKPLPSSSEHNEISSLSPYEKLTLWKTAFEKHLNHIYLNKLKELDSLLSQGKDQIDIEFDKIPSLKQSVIITNRQQTTDHTYDDMEFDYSNAQAFDLKSNNILLSTSNNHTLIYDDIKSNLILYNKQSKLNSYLWDVNEYGEPCDLSYSYYLNLYCIITNRGLFTWSVENPYVPLYIDSIKSIGGKRLWTIASTDTRSDVFILFKSGSYIERWNSISGTKSWQHIKRWSNHDLFERNDQCIRTIRMTSKYVAWTVESTKTFEWRVDLLDYNLRMVRQGIKIDHLDRSSSCLLSNFDFERFLIIDSNCHLLFLLDTNGSMKLKNDFTMKKRIKNAVLMKNNNQQWLVVRLEQPNQLYFIPLLNKTVQTTFKNITMRWYSCLLFFLIALLSISALPTDGNANEKSLITVGDEDKLDMAIENELLNDEDEDEIDEDGTFAITERHHKQGKPQKHRKPKDSDSEEEDDKKDKKKPKITKCFCYQVRPSKHKPQQYHHKKPENSHKPKPASAEIPSEDPKSEED
ncbi:unnamed protein product [Rotaria magnacalcarata]